jgi:hypothetical protein
MSNRLRHLSHRIAPIVSLHSMLPRAAEFPLLRHPSPMTMHEHPLGLTVTAYMLYMDGSAHSVTVNPLGKGATAC